MNRPNRVCELNWQIDNISEEWMAEKILAEWLERYPTAEVYHDQTGIFDKAYPIFYWFVNIAFENKEDEAVFMLRESA